MARLSQPWLWLLFFPTYQGLRPLQICKYSFDSNLCFDSTSPSVVKKHHSLLRGCKAQFLSIRQAYLKFNHKGKVSDCQNQISSYFSIMHTSIMICTESSLINSLSASVLVSENGMSLFYFFCTVYDLCFRN